MQCFGSLDKEFDYVLHQIQSLESEGTPLKNICVVARTNRLVDEYATRFSSAGVDTFRIRRSRQDDRNRDGVRLATMHRVKGLEFDHVFVVAVNKNTVPHPTALEHADEVSLREAITAERCLLYVALTRAKKTAYVTSHGALSEFVVDVEREVESAQ